MPLYPGIADSTIQVTDVGGVAGGTTAGFPPKCIFPGDKSDNLFNAEQPVLGQVSDRVALGSVYENHPGTLSVEGFFSGAPGAYELDLQTADTDADALYGVEGTGITTILDVNASSFRGEFINVTARFARLFLKARANAVNITARIIRK